MLRPYRSHQTGFIGDTSSLPGPEPTLYFAPVQIRKRNADWGPHEVNRRFNEAQKRFIDELARPGNRWMTLEPGQGLEHARSVIAALGAGAVDPRLAHVVRLGVGQTC